ncbi:MAG: GNAT family N-acetyltransferase [Pseudozobellia sp.]|nr:GNAT family N-acetyltransferase [Pseudozobellia sp.]MBG48867.1 GNAT family N-acetyltransferase [Pseudozobellia sp.]|tara:strand:- start:270 stop:722 length:453 start_codon:yes stop_codon:yes gene_type:complete
MNVIIKKIKDNFPYEILLIADETVDAINKYVFDSDVYLAIVQQEAIGAFCLLSDNEGALEIKNIAIVPQWQNRGIGSFLLAKIEEIAKKEEFKTITVGTADTGKRQISFYIRNGYAQYAVKKNFFLKNYNQPIYENGIMLKDMIILKKNI